GKRLSSTLLEAMAKGYFAGGLRSLLKVATHDEVRASPRTARPARRYGIGPAAGGGCARSRGGAVRCGRLASLPVPRTAVCALDRDGRHVERLAANGRSGLA